MSACGHAAGTSRHRQGGRPGDVKTGPQIDRIFSAPFGGLTSLNEPEPKAKPTRARMPAVAAEGASVPPSNAAKPETAAVETNPAIKSPADGKVDKVATAAAEEDVTPAKAAAVAKPSLEDPNRPKGIDRPATPDNLQLISGVGSKIEGILHGLGIYTYAQVAGWQQNERDWVDAYLNFKGRIDRDDWVRQARALADGGEAEYIRVFGKKPR